MSNYDLKKKKIKYNYNKKFKPCILNRSRENPVSHALNCSVASLLINIDRQKIYFAINPC